VDKQIKVIQIANDHAETYISTVIGLVKDNVSLAILLLPSNNEERYSRIKRELTCGNVAITTQVVVANSKLKTLSVWTNIVLQICAKLGATLWATEVCIFW
jgi:hypothetical protein